MNRTTLRAGALAVVTTVVLSSLLVWQRSANTRLRQELSQLREETTQSGRLRDDNERLGKENQRLAQLKIDHDEMERLRLENGELLRLRGQVGVAKGALALKQAS